MDTDPGAARFCPVCARSLTEFGPGPGRRPRAACPHCGSLERHRLVALVVGGAAALLAGADSLELFRAGEDPPVLTGPGTVPRRFAVPAADSPAAADPTGESRTAADPASEHPAGPAGPALPFGDGSFDLVVVSQVLDRRPDPDAVATELARVLRPGGVAVLHGAGDLAAVLAGAGLAAARQPVSDLAGPELTARLGLLPQDGVWIARRSQSPTAAPAAGRQPVAQWLATALLQAEQARAAALTETRILTSRLGALEDSLRRRAERAEHAADESQRRYDALRARLPVRVAAAVQGRTAAVRRGLGRVRGVR